MKNTTARDALARTIACRLQALSHDELRVLDVVSSRMLGVGRESYGPLVIAKDRRDWKAAGAEEAADLIFYAACDAIVRNDERLERLQCEAHDEQRKRDLEREPMHGFLGVEAGLAELRDSRPIVRPHIEFDMSDLDDQGGES